MGFFFVETKFQKSITKIEMQQKLKEKEKQIAIKSKNDKRKKKKKKKDLPIKMSNGNNLSTHIVIKSVDTVSIDKTVTNPESSADTFLNLTNNLKE